MSDHQRREFERQQQAIIDARNGRPNNHPAAEMERKKIEASRSRHSKPGGKGCFSAQTPVLTPAGWRPISQIQAGDEVCTWSVDGRLEASPVLHVRRKEARQCMRLVLENGVTVTLTPRHPLRVGDAWRQAAQVQIGDVLPAVDDAGRTGLARVVEVHAKADVTDVFHLYCGGECTYIVQGAVSHCFSVARPLFGGALNAAIAVIRFFEGSPGRVVRTN